MWSRVFRRLVLTSAIIAAFLCLAPKLAHAQAAITIYQETSLPRYGTNANGDYVQLSKRAINLTPEGVNNQDCVNDVRIRFPLQLAGFEGNGTLEAWAGLSGEACTDNAVRTGTNRTCWKISSGIPLSLNQNVDIPVRTIMSGIKSTTALDTSAAICGQVDLTTVSVNFLYFSPGATNTPSSTKSVSVQIDTVGPSPPSGLNALPGNGRLSMNWNSISGEGGVTVLTGIRVYCDVNHSAEIPNVPECQDLIKERNTTPLTSQDAGTDAGADAGDAEAGTTSAVLEDGGCINEFDDTGDATFTCDSGTGTSSGGASVDGTSLGTGGTCDTSNLQPSTGKFSPTAAFNKCFSCGSISGNTGTSIVASDLRGSALVNNTVYSIAVAATDAFDNVGPLSDIRCEYPELTNDFWEEYRAAGGNAGGGCSTTSNEAPIGSIAVFGVSMAVVIGVLRRKRKK